MMVHIPGAPLTYFNDEEGPGEARNFFKVCNFGQKGFFGSMKDTGIFWVAKKPGLFLGIRQVLHQLKTITNVSAIYCYCQGFFGV